MNALHNKPTFDTARLNQTTIHWLTQRFSDAEIERVFLRSYGRRSWLACLWGQGAGIVAFLLNYVTLMMSGDPVLISLANDNLMYITPLQMLVLGLSFHPYFVRYQQPVVMVMVTGLMLLWMHLIFLKLPVGLAYSSGYGIMVIILLFNYLIARMRFFNSVMVGASMSLYFLYHLYPVVERAISTGAINIASLGSIIDGGPLPMNPFINYFNVLVVANIAGGVGAYAMEHLERKNFISRQINRRQTAMLAQERERSENLLLNIMPPAIAQRLKQSTNSIADSFYSVSVVFVDIVGFTRISHSRDPQIIVNWLNNVFTRFDGVVQEHGMEKIKTIGDAYMAVAGVPNHCEDHADRAADAALAIIQACENIRDPDNLPMRVRIGIATGPAVAGVIGAYKFSYDLWGDTVNTASRMESLGQTDRIQVCPTTFALLETHYQLEERGLIDIKGRPAMRTWWLKGKRLEDDMPIADINPS
jgi:class 3 adenylate cyclase